MNRPSASPPKWSQWRHFIDFVVRRRTRILLTIFLALVVDFWGGRILQLSLSDIHSPTALLGLASVLAGCTLFAWAAGGNRDQLQNTANGQYSNIKDPCICGLFLSMLGFGLLLDNPRNICVLVGPMILLDLIRLRREDSNALPRRGSQRAPARAASWATPAWLRSLADFSTAQTPTSSAAQEFYHKNSLLPIQRYAPLSIVPVVALAVIAYAWPFDSLEFHETWEIRCLLLSFAGLAIRMLAAGQLAETTHVRGGLRPASRLTTDGIYSIVRHPRYWGDYCIGLGVVLIPFVWWLPLLYSLAFHFYYKRVVVVDEQGLRRKFGEQFELWAAATPALIPRISKWRPASNPFSLRAALKAEHSALFLVIALHSSVEWLEHLILDRRIMLEVFWLILALVGLTAYVLIRYLVKHTRVLNVSA